MPTSIITTRDQLLEKIKSRLQLVKQISSADYQVKSYLNLQNVLEQLPNSFEGETIDQLEKQLTMLEEELLNLSEIKNPLVNIQTAESGKIFRLYHKKVDSIYIHLVL